MLRIDYIEKVRILNSKSKHRGKSGVKNWRSQLESAMIRFFS